MKPCSHLATVLTDQPNTPQGCEHFQASGHPIISSLERGEDWSWCHVDHLVLEIE